MNTCRLCIFPDGHCTSSLLFGSGPRIELQPADEYTSIVIVMPVTYHGGLAKPVDRWLLTDHRAATLVVSATSKWLATMPLTYCQTC